MSGPLSSALAVLVEAVVALPEADRAGRLDRAAGYARLVVRRGRGGSAARGSLLGLVAACEAAGVLPDAVAEARRAIAAGAEARARKADKPKGFCPRCAALVTLGSRGRTVRHGFSAHEVRHGQSTGWHAGGHGGDMPIGTAVGDRTALVIAKHYDEQAAGIEALPPVSAEEALEDCIVKARRSLLRQGARETAEFRARYAAPDAFANTSVRSWFSADALEGRRARLQDSRAGHVAWLRGVADLLRALVAEHGHAAKAAKVVA